VDPEPALRSLVALCRSSAASPRTHDVPAPVPSFDETKCRNVLEAFLGALRDRDAHAIIARAHPRLFLGWQMEPTPETLVAKIEEARARPSSWGEDVYVHASTGGSRTLETLRSVDESEVSCVNLAIAIEREGGRAGVYVCMLRIEGERWLVSGYLVGAKLVLGVEFPPSGD
jgi:hypothetical protein